MTINASEAIIGTTYSTYSGILVEVVEKKNDRVIVKSSETGNDVTIPLDYPLSPIVKIIEVKEKAMSETNEPSNLATAVEPKPKTGKLKKSNVVDEGLKAGLSVEDIVKNVLASFPETPEKNARNLVSVRRSKLKGATA